MSDIQVTTYTGLDGLEHHAVTGPGGHVLVTTNRYPRTGVEVWAADGSGTSYSETHLERGLARARRMVAPHCSECGFRRVLVAGDERGRCAECVAAAQLPDDSDRCPACGDVIDYCQGHGEIGDPAGFAILEAHADLDHSGCHEAAHCG